MKHLALEWIHALNISKKERLLDIGCGNGETVNLLRMQGYQAFGIDVEFKNGKHTNELIEKGYIKKILSPRGRKSIKEKNNSYRWPIESESIGFSFSSSVIEHVANLEEFTLENHRCLRDKGLCLHYYPSRTALREAHTGILLGGLLQNRQYIEVHSKLIGTYNEFANNGEESYQYIKNFTHYRSQKQIIKIFEEHGFKFLDDMSHLTAQSKGKRFIAALIKNLRLARFGFNLARSNASLFKNEASHSYGIHHENQILPMRDILKN